MDPKDCCGCSACANICPKQAIQMKPDALGFLYPRVNEEECANCGLCEKVCSFNDNYNTSNNLATPIAYAVRHKEACEIMKSRSGAAFAAFSDWILERGGVVYGAGYSDHFRVTHKRATNTKERDEFRGSKYVQSDMGNTFKQVKEDLRNGLLVMFTGTPCQTSALRTFVGETNADHLYLIDVVCHGVPGPFIWQDYLSYIERKHQGTVVSVDFRDKHHFGWRAHQESFTLSPNRYVSARNYTECFYQHIMLRHSCEVCHFTNLKRPSDITLADFWGWEKTNAQFNADDRGCNLILCNTKKGEQLFEDVKSQLRFIPADLKNCMQPNLQHPSVIHPQRMDFERDYASLGFEGTMSKYRFIGWKYEWDQLKIRIKQPIKKLLGRE